MKYISTTAIAKERELKPSELFNQLDSQGWIIKKGKKWNLTETGSKAGGQIRKSSEFGEFIVWPQDVSFEKKSNNTSTKYHNATAIGKHLGVSSKRMNLILSELGWIKKKIAGWDVTKFGKSLGGKQFEASQGFTYVIWPENILTNGNLNSIMKDDSTSPSQSTNQITSNKPANKANEFREKFPATLRTKDGHMVRSRAEVIIDNALYDYNLAHAYERKLPVEEESYTCCKD